MKRFKLIVTSISSLLVCILFTSALSLKAESFGRLKGIVKDPEGNKLSYINLQLNGPCTYSLQADQFGRFYIDSIVSGNYLLKSAHSGFTGQQKVNILHDQTVSVVVQLQSTNSKNEVVDEEDRMFSAPVMEKRKLSEESGGRAYTKPYINHQSNYGIPRPLDQSSIQIQHNTESYDFISENRFMNALQSPLSTFSIDVDAASYSNMRRFITNGQNPPKDAVRIEEMINYFNYQYPEPKGAHPFTITTELTTCPWNPEHDLVHIGLQGRHIAMDNLPQNNLVFLLDVSGSMSAENKLPLLKQSLKLLVNQMREQDRVAIVVYAGAAGLVLPSTSGADKNKIIAALDQLNAGGSTAGGAGIQLAYKVARENFAEEGNNRIILATDGDFNIGASSDGEMTQLIEEQRKSGVYISVLGFGMGNYKDSKMEKIADHGNGNYAYIDNLMEAKKVLVNEMGANLFAIAKDVKIQVEFNPNRVASYKLIGYENRLLNKEDFNDDTKDAGEIGAGHSVTALYEIVRVEAKAPSVDPLRYQKREEIQQPDNEITDELLTVKFRYKHPKEEQSQLIVRHLKDCQLELDQASRNLQFASSVAEFGLLLRDSPFKASASLDHVLKVARATRGEDEFGYRSEFIRLVELYQLQQSN